MDTDGTQEQGDVALATAEEETPETLTREEHDAAVKKAVLDATTKVNADVGRQKAEANKALKAATAAQTRVETMQREQDEAAAEAVRDDPEGTSLLKARQEARRLKAELETKNTELEEANTRNAEFEAEETKAGVEDRAKEVARRLGVKPADLVKLAKLTDGTTESIEVAASTLNKVTVEQNLNPDSGRTAGGSSQTKIEIMDRFGKGLISNVEYEKQMKAIGAHPGKG